MVFDHLSLCIVFVREDELLSRKACQPHYRSLVPPGKEIPFLSSGGFFPLGQTVGTGYGVVARLY